MSYKRKTTDLWIVQGYYPGTGWEDLTASYSRKEMRDDLKAYRENAPGTYRLIKTREKIETAAAA